MLADAVNQTSAEWLFIGMFDEYDEATNLIPASDDPPVPDNDSSGNPLTFQVSDPRPNDWWLALTGAAEQALQGKIAIDDTLPTEAELNNRSNVGGEAGWTVSQQNRLAIVSTSGSQVLTRSFLVDGQLFDAAYSLSNYLHFQVSDSFLSPDGDWDDLTVEVEYLDDGSGQFNLEYGTPGALALSSPALLTGSGQWRVHRFELSNADFSNSLAGDADFRLVKAGGDFHVGRVRVIKESALAASVALAATNDPNGLVQVEVGDGQTVATNTGGRDARLVTGAPPRATCTSAWTTTSRSRSARGSMRSLRSSTKMSAPAHSVSSTTRWPRLTR